MSNTRNTEAAQHTRPGPPDIPQGPPSTQPQEGWHVVHLYYQIKRDILQKFSSEQRAQGREQWAQELTQGNDDSPPRLQVYSVMGNKADFGIVLMGPDPLQLDRVQNNFCAGLLGPALHPVYSFVSLSEVSEYVPTVEQYGQRLEAEGTDPESDAFEAKLNVYRNREEKMRQQRLYPEIPDWPSICFYPMNKKRDVGENWFLLDAEKRMDLMTQHGRIGQTFAGKVVQLITASTGLDDWEWGVTLWAHNPVYIKDVVYTMRFDEASARYASFGPFYQGYIMPASQLFEHLKV
ncbi:MAG: heme-dependent peroxidase [Planctomycetes bacterium]|nr:heme-dependent peroxidase [Planctomycetota bacterium]